MARTVTQRPSDTQANDEAAPLRDRDARGRDALTGKTNVGKTERMLSVLAGGALIAYGLTRGQRGPGIAIALGGGALAARGVSGQCMAYRALGVSTATMPHSAASVVQHNEGIRVEEVVTINQRAETLYRFWRNFENLPRFMQHLDSVTVIDDTHSHWVANAPAGASVAWDAEIINEEANRLIAWKSTEEAQIPNAGSVRFTEAPGGRGTEVRVNFEYAPPAGKLGAAVAAIFGEEPRQQVKDELRHFKQLMEAGVIPSVDGQPHGKRSKV